jgi:hypothetical protein
VAPQHQAKWLVKIYRLQAERGVRPCPGRIGPAMAGFFVEPMPLDFWRLKKSPRRSPQSSFPPLPAPLHRCFDKLRDVLRHSPEPAATSARFAIVTLLAVPTQPPLPTTPNCYNQRLAIRYVFPIDGGIVIVALVFGERRRYSRLASPEIIGRIVFFILAVGRSPPPADSPSSSELL